MCRSLTAMGCAVLREEHPTPTPQPMAIELRHVRQGVVPAVVVVAVGCLPLPQPPAGSVDAATDQLRHLSQHHDLTPSKGFPCSLRSRIGTFAHRRSPLTDQVYDILQLTNIYLSIREHNASGKSRTNKEKQPVHPSCGREITLSYT